jgi:hypothetical protein
VWYRVQNSCSVIAPTNDTDNEFVKVPYSNQIIPTVELGPTLAMINKGNILQYKKNSSNLTQQQKYSQIAKGKWVNRTTTWASPVTCPTPPIINNNVLPPNSGESGMPPPPPPPPPPPVDSGTAIPVISVPVVEPIVIPDFGNLVCGTQENLCTGEVIMPIKLDNCNPTTDSDVPGAIELLCWNDGNPTWYPRQRYIMNNSTDKWPVNAVLESAIKPSTPILSATIDCNVATLSWYSEFECLPVTSYNIYQNGEFLVNILKNSYSLTLEYSIDYNFNIIALNGTIASYSSNILDINIQPIIPDVPINLSATVNIDLSITLTWDPPSNTNFISYYNLYLDYVYITSVASNVYSYTFTGLYFYTYYATGVSCVNKCGFESPMSIINADVTGNYFSYTYNPVLEGFTDNYYYILFENPSPDTITFYIDLTLNSSISSPDNIPSELLLYTQGLNGVTFWWNLPPPPYPELLQMSKKIKNQRIQQMSNLLQLKPIHIQPIHIEPIPIEPIPIEPISIEPTPTPIQIKKIFLSSTVKKPIAAPVPAPTNNTIYKIFDTIPVIGHFQLPDYTTNFIEIVIFNRTNNFFKIKSKYIIYNSVYYPKGSYEINIPRQSKVTCIYVNQNNIITINASIL